MDGRLQADSIETIVGTLKIYCVVLCQRKWHQNIIPAPEPVRNMCRMNCYNVKIIEYWPVKDGNSLFIKYGWCVQTGLSGYLFIIMIMYVLWFYYDDALRLVAFNPFSVLSNLIYTFIFVDKFQVITLKKPTLLHSATDSSPCCKLLIQDLSSTSTSALPLLPVTR